MDDINETFWQKVMSYCYFESSTIEEAIKHVAIHHPNELNAYDYIGFTPLHHAIHTATQYGDIAVKTLIELGGNVHLKTQAPADFNYARVMSTIEIANELLNEVKNRPHLDEQINILEKVIEMLTIHIEKDQLEKKIKVNHYPTHYEKI